MSLISLIRILTILICLFLLGCYSNKQPNNSADKTFKIPYIKQHEKIDTAKYFIAENISSIFPVFVGQFKFSDTIQLTRIPEKRDSITEKQYNWELQVFEFDTLSSDGLQIIPDYKTTVFYCNDFSAKNSNSYFPVYIVNETSIPKLFLAKDNHIFGIQEAIDTSDNMRWYPIECRGFDFCDNGFFRRKLMPQEFIMVLFPKYKGNELSQMRVRIEIAGNLFVSKPFIGRFNKKQFDLKKGSMEYDYLQKTKGIGYNGLFYGASPKNLDKL